MVKNKQNIFLYRIAQIVSWFVAVFIFKRKTLRNEIKGKKGPFVVIANHQAALDFVNLIGVTCVPMRFVISNSFYSTLPIKWFLDKIGVIPKQQFQTSLSDMKRMKSVIDNGQPLVIYPAGLMCENGVSTPIPTATYKFLKWLNTDVYVAKVSGTYFSMPKWSKGIRPGRTHIDIYKLFSKEELSMLDVHSIKEKTDNEILFDAYREQEHLLVKYKSNDNLEGIENVLYVCPNCGREFTVKVKNKNTLYCTECGYEEVSDKFQFLHNHCGIGKELRYISDWSKLIYENLKIRIKNGIDAHLSAKGKIHIVDPEKNKFIEVGYGSISLSSECFVIDGTISGKDVSLSIPITTFASLPCKPGKHFEIQHGNTIYRCVLDDGKLVMKFINMVKIFYELNTTAISQQEKQ